MNEEPVTILSRRMVCENQKFRIFFDHLVDREHEVADYLVVAPKYQVGNQVTGVAVLPIVSDRVGMIRIYRPAIRGFSWEIPHGFAEEGETAPVSAVRELAEETGLDFDYVESLGFITPDSGVLAGRVHLFLAKGVSKGGKQVGEIGLREFRLFEIDEFERMIESSEVQDSFTLSAWCKYKLHCRLDLGSDGIGRGEI